MLRNFHKILQICLKKKLNTTQVSLWAGLLETLVINKTSLMVV